MYAKVFAQIYDGTLCTNGPWQALVTFQQLLVLADLDGNVDMTVGAIARRTTIPIDILTLGVEALLKPDPESRTPTEEGRRILPLVPGRPWGWRIVNYKHYRAMKREEERREYHREYWRNNRSPAAKGPGSIESPTTQSAQDTQHKTQQAQQPQQNQPIAEAEAEAKAEAKAGKTARKRAAASQCVSHSDLVLEGVDAQHATDWLAARKAKSLILTATAWAAVKDEATKAGLTPSQAVAIAAADGWAGFKASWLARRSTGASGPTRQSSIEAHNAATVARVVSRVSDEGK